MSEDCGRKTRRVRGLLTAVVLSRLARVVLAPVAGWSALLLALGLMGPVACSAPDQVNPMVEMLTPQDGGVVDRALVTVTAKACDDRGVSRVEFYFDGRLTGVTTTGRGDTFGCDWDTRELAELTSHSVRVRAYDAAGNSTTAASTVTVRSGMFGPTYHSGEIASDTWRATGNPHVVTGDVSLAQGAILVILPGSYVSFQQTRLRAGTRAGSAIIAEGKPDSAIVFTSGFATPRPGDWVGIAVESLASAATRFRHCRIDYAGLGDAALRVGCAGVSIRDCAIRYSGTTGLRLDCDRIGEFTGNLIDSCADYPIHLRAGVVASLGPGCCELRRAWNGLAVTGGSIRRSGTWSDLGMPYLLEDSVVIGDDDSCPVLTVAAGVTVKARMPASFGCGLETGTLICEGRPEAPILFTSAEEAPEPGDWVGIRLNYGSAPDTRFRFCTIECAESGLRVHGLGVVIRDCVIRDCQDWGLIASSGLTEFRGNTVTGCGNHPLCLSAEILSAVAGDNTLTGNARDYIRVENAEVHTSAHWVDPGVPLWFAYGIAIGDDNRRPVVTIAPGVEILCGRQVTVGAAEAGGLVADGTSAGISFSGCGEPPQPGDWFGITFGPYAIPDSCILRRCRIEYGGGVSRGNIRIDGCLPVIVEDSIGHSATCGIRLAGSPVPDTATLRADNTLYDNALGDFGN